MRLPWNRRPPAVVDASPPEDLEDETSGWDAITAAMVALHGAPEKRHVAYHPGVAFGSPLQGASVFDAGDHWHYVTYGLSELFGPDPDVAPEVSGWGIELTMRVVRGTDDAPPEWPFGMVAALAAQVRETGWIPAHGSRADMQSPITGYPWNRAGVQTGLTAFAFVVDGPLGRIVTPHGSVTFMQAVGVTEGERVLMTQSTTDEVLAVLPQVAGLPVTDPGRA
ncbi:suppressor of fused domain protein [Cellulomonas soli]|uniref:suppressor of fused domain protein n=1 Tax=Cellulomonas soli TaxID=931535 RepID=UPI003F872DB2